MQLDSSLLQSSNCTKSLNHQKVGTALTQPDYRLIHKINNSTDTLYRTADPYTGISFSMRVISYKLSLAVDAFTFTSSPNYFFSFAEKEITTPGL